jgi:hypothetical protein
LYIADYGDAADRTSDAAIVAVIGHEVFRLE